MFRFGPPLAVMVLSVLFSVSHAEVYKWTDEHGVTHYGDKPASADSAEQIEVKQQTVDTQPSGSRAERRQKLIESLDEDRYEKKQERERQQAKAKRDRQRCHRLKDHLKSMQRASRAYRLDKDGERVYLSDAGKSKSEARIRKQMRKYCR